MVHKREVLPDPKYGDEVLSKFINILMLNGKKAVAEGIVYKAFDYVSDKTGEEPLKVFHAAVSNVKPQLEVRSRRVGGATYQIPVEVRSERARALAFRWIVENARNRGEQTMVERLGVELVEAFNGRGGSMKKRETVHKMAEANRAFAHYRW
jgi:small subunit ribosomal protein S7